MLLIQTRSWPEVEIQAELKIGEQRRLQESLWGLCLCFKEWPCGPEKSRRASLGKSGAGVAKYTCSVMAINPRCLHRGSEWSTPEKRQDTGHLEIACLGNLSV